MAKKAKGGIPRDVSWLAPGKTYKVVIHDLGTYRVNSGPRGMTVTSAIIAAIVALTGKVAYIPIWNEIQIKGTTITAKPVVRLSAPRYP